MKQILVTTAMAAALMAALPCHAADKAYKVPKKRFDAVVSAIAVLPCENNIPLSIVEAKQRHIVATYQLHKEMNTGYRAMINLPGVEVRAAEEETKLWIARFAGNDGPIILRSQRAIDSMMHESLSALKRFTIHGPVQCAAVKKEVFVQQGIATRYDTVRLSFDSTLQRAIADTFIERLPGDAIMTMSLHCHPMFQDNRGTLYLQTSIMSKARELYWEQWAVLADIEEKTDLAVALNDNGIQKMITTVLKSLKR